MKDEAYQKEFADANAGAAKAVKDFDAWLREQEKKANDNFALGSDKFKQMLKQTEGVDIDLREKGSAAKPRLDENRV